MMRSAPSFPRACRYQEARNGIVAARYASTPLSAVTGGCPLSGAGAYHDVMKDMLDHMEADGRITRDARGWYRLCSTRKLTLVPA